MYTYMDVLSEINLIIVNHNHGYKDSLDEQEFCSCPFKSMFPTLESQRQFTVVSTHVPSNVIL